jgi:hypothetical protein
MGSSICRPIARDQPKWGVVVHGERVTRLDTGHVACPLHVAITIVAIAGVSRNGESIADCTTAPWK